MSVLFEIQNLHAGVLTQGETDLKKILHGVSLKIYPGETHAIMGPNGSGKSTLSNIILGHPKYKILEGDILFEGNSILKFTTDERARLGIFLSFQYPSTIQGVTVSSFLKTILKVKNGNKDLPFKQLRSELDSSMKLLEMDNKFLSRYVNDGFSGGEKKRNEILQLNLLKPKLAILDEIDSGLDIDALRVVSNGINESKDGKRSLLLITHYQRMLDYIIPDFIHVFANGKILKTGTKELAFELEKKGYDWIINQ